MDALCRIVEIDCTISKLRALFPELTGKRCILQDIAPLVWARKPVVRFAPLVRLTPLTC